MHALIIPYAFEGKLSFLLQPFQSTLYREATVSSPVGIHIYIHVIPLSHSLQPAHDNRLSLPVTIFWIILRISSRASISQIRPCRLVNETKLVHYSTVYMWALYSSLSHRASSSRIHYIISYCEPCTVARLAGHLSVSIHSRQYYHFLLWALCNSSLYLPVTIYILDNSFLLL